MYQMCSEQKQSFHANHASRVYTINVNARPVTGVHVEHSHIKRVLFSHSATDVSEYSLLCTCLFKLRPSGDWTSVVTSQPT